MEFVIDMGAHALFVWPAYGAFLVIFGALALWVIQSGKTARARLKRAEEEAKR